MTKEYGPVAKLVDALDLGSSAFGVRVRVSPGPPFKLRERKLYFLMLEEDGSHIKQKFVNIFVQAVLVVPLV